MGRTADKLSAVADELICSADLDGYYSDVNPAFTRLLGWTEAELINRPYMDFVHEGDQDATRGAVESLKRSGKLTAFRNRLVTKDGDSVWIEWKTYLHEGEIYAIGRRREGRTTESNLESVVTRVLREESGARRAALEARDDAIEAERSQKDALVADADHSAKMANSRAGTFKTWAAAFVAIAGAVGGFGSWAIGRVEASALQTHKAEERKEHVDSELSESKTRDELQDKKLRVLGRGQIQTAVQISDSTEYTAKQLRAMSSKAGEIPEPPTVEKARVRAEAIKEDIAIDELFNVADPDDASNPFAGIEEQPKTKKDTP